MSETDASAIFRPLWRRKWLILAVAVIVGAASYFYYKHQTKLFQSSTQIYLGGPAEEGVSGEKARSSTVTPATDVAVLQSIIVPQVRQQLRKAGELAPAKGVVKAKAAEKSPFISITTEAHTPK